MLDYSLQLPQEERARKRNAAPALDSIVSKKIISAAPRGLGTVRTRSFVAPLSRQRLNDIKNERQSFLALLQELSFADTCTRLWRKGQLYSRRMRRLILQVVPRFTPHKMLYGSLVGGIAFGMVSMAFMERYFGPGVFARSQAPSETMMTYVPSQETAPAPTVKNYDPEQDVFFEYFGQVTKEKYEESIRDMVKGYPIEAMLPYIFAQDRLTAAFLIGIAKKESNWGRRIPVLAGQDCFNYWGYRGVRRMMGSGGHTCFNGREDAVESVTKRLETLIHSEKLNTPEKMIVWKCGFSCQGHSRESVKKWITDVDMYFSQLSDE